jgi:hypothetical protein
VSRKNELFFKEFVEDRRRPQPRAAAPEADELTDGSESGYETAI